jgi:hypothetical protein
MTARQVHFKVTLLVVIAAFLFLPPQSEAQTKSEKAFNAIITDTQGVETEVKNVFFYWEERISETAFVPHEVRQLPVKRGTATVQVKFDSMKQIDVKQSTDKTLPTFTIALANGKTGDFAAALAGSFRGESDFGQTEIPITTITKVVFK